MSDSESESRDGSRSRDEYESGDESPRSSRESSVEIMEGVEDVSKDATADDPATPMPVRLNYRQKKALEIARRRVERAKAKAEAAKIAFPKLSKKDLARLDEQERARKALKAAYSNPTFPEGSLQERLFPKPFNSSSKLRRERPTHIANFERLESSRNPSNPFQDTSDSELDEIESDYELELAVEEERAKVTKPRLNLLQDGDICFYCGGTVPYDNRKSTPYPKLYQCGTCLQSTSQAPISENTLCAHKEALLDLEGNVRLNNNGWFPPLPWSTTSRPENEKIAEKLQTLPSPEKELLWQRVVDDRLKLDRRSFRDLTKHEQSIKYWTRGRTLVGGGMAWTVEEGDLFFQGLRRYGKHNVWAVQEHVRSRSLAEVVTMIQAMEMELARCTYFGLGKIRLSQMPMAQEVSQEQIDIEEQCAAILTERELRERWRSTQSKANETRNEYVKKSRLFNLRTLSELSSRVYIQNEGAETEREVVWELYDSLKEWLRPLVKELVVLHQERRRVQHLLQKELTLDTMENEAIKLGDVLRVLSARQLPLDTAKFFATLPSRIEYLPFDDRPEAMRKETFGLKPPSSLWTKDGLGKKYYLNEEVDRAQAAAPDSDQDMDTDDGIMAEEALESSLEAPLPMLPDIAPCFPNEAAKATDDFFEKQKLDTEYWNLFWAAHAYKARHPPPEGDSALLSIAPAFKKRRRFRETHPLIPTAMSYDSWKEGTERLSANSHSLPLHMPGNPNEIPVSTDLSVKAPIVSMNKRARSHEQDVYLENLRDLARQKKKYVKVEDYHADMTRKARETPSSVREVYAPGYGVLPKNASFLHDPTRNTPKSGFGLGQRTRGGLWMMDKNPHELLNSSGYITVSDTEDEEEEEAGWARQMKADKKIERSEKASK